MSPIDPRTRENPEAAICHAKARGDVYGGPNCMFPDSCGASQRCVTAGSCEARGNPSAAFFDLSQAQALNRPPATEAKPESWPWPIGPSDREVREASARRDLGIDLHSLINAGELPGFDSEAHRAFMRGLG